MKTLDKSQKLCLMIQEKAERENRNSLEVVKEIQAAIKKLPSMETKPNLKILYVDMDNVLVYFQSGLIRIDKETLKKYKGRKDDIPGIFASMEPMEGAIEAFNLLADHFNTYILTTAPWENPTVLQDKRDWVKKNLPEKGYKRLIISHHKNLNKGDYIIDDRDKKGVDKFDGEHIWFGKSEFLDWGEVVEYLCQKEDLIPPK